MTQAEIIAKYGQPGDTKNFTTIALPYPMRIAWDPSVTVKKMQIHKSQATAVKAIFTKILATYGLAEIQRLRIDYFGGSYNFRKMRGGSNWSVHSWALAIDLDPAQNTLTMKDDDATLDNPEYKAMIDIFYEFGWYSLGREQNRDWMHFQAFKP